MNCMLETGVLRMIGKGVLSAYKESKEIWTKNYWKILEDALYRCFEVPFVRQAYTYPKPSIPCT